MDLIERLIYTVAHRAETVQILSASVMTASERETLSLQVVGGMEHGKQWTQLWKATDGKENKGRIIGGWTIKEHSHQFNNIQIIKKNRYPQLDSPLTNPCGRTIFSKWVKLSKLPLYSRLASSGHILDRHKAENSQSNLNSQSKIKFCKLPCLPLVLSSTL